MDIEDIDIKEHFYPNGQLQYYMPFLNGLPYGTHLCFNPDGSLGSEHRYENGLLEGLCIIYKRDGRKWIVFTCSKELQEGEDIEYEY